MNEELQPGTTFEVKYPFTLEDYSEWSEDGPCKMKSWQPGVRMVERFIPPYDMDVDAIADGEGLMILTVVGTYKPGRFPTRVFYTRKWRDPKGREFGKSRCRIATTEKFRRLARSYQHEYVVKAVNG